MENEQQQPQPEQQYLDAIQRYQQSVQLEQQQPVAQPGPAASTSDQTPEPEVKTVQDIVAPAPPEKTRKERIIEACSQAVYEMLRAQGIGLGWNDTLGPWSLAPDSMKEECRMAVSQVFTGEGLGKTYAQTQSDLIVSTVCALGEAIGCRRISKTRIEL